MYGFRLSLLGGFELRDAAGAVVRLPTRKTEALLARLALAPSGGVSRDALCSLLWGESAQSAARASLRQALSLLGKALGREALSGGSAGVALAAGALACDVVEFEQCCASEDGAQLARAAALYRGELLAGVSINDSGFEDWLLVERERLRERALDALARLVVWHRDRGESAPAIQAALRLLSIDPLEEVAHRALMRLYADQGRRASALRQYQACLGVLRRELGTEPEAATRELYHAILQSGGARPAPAAPTEPLPHEAPLVGRGAELEQGARLLEDLVAGRGRVLALVGEAGIGKTRLAEEISALALREGAQVFTGRCHESQQAFAFAPLVEMLRDAGVPRDAALLQELEPPWRAELPRLLPELARDGIDAGSGEALSRQGRLVDAVIRVLDLLAQRAPLLLVFEDLHWADDMSLRLLAAAGRHARGRRIGLVLTLRDEELPGAQALSRMLHELDRHAALQQLRLAPLSREDTDALVAALSRRGMQAQAVARLAERVWRESEGNPFVVTESVRAAQADPGVAEGVGAALPGRVRALVEAQLDRLDAAPRQLLQLAAVSGTECDFAVLQRAAAMDARAASAALEELVRRRMLRAVGERFDFEHDRVRRVVMDALLAPARGQLHLALAEALEALHAEQLEPAYAQLAFHYARSSRRDKALHYLQRAAERAARAGGHAQAVAALDEALARLSALPPAEQARRRHELVMRRARSLVLLGRMQEAAESLRAEQRFVDAAADPRVAGPYHMLLGATCHYLDERAESRRHAGLALAAATACSDIATMGKAHVTLANVSLWAEPREGARHGAEAVRLLAGTAERWWLGQAYWILGLNLAYCGELRDALDAQASAAALGEENADQRLACISAWASGFTHALSGELDAALADCRRSLETAPDALYRMTAAAMLGLALVERHEPREAIALLDAVIVQAERFSFQPLLGQYLGLRAEAALQCGEIDEARRFGCRSEALTRQTDYRLALGWTQRVLARIERADGNAASACDHMQRAIATFSDMGARHEVARTQRELDAWLAAPQRAA